jgi:hypothetical protein
MNTVAICGALSWTIYHRFRLLSAWYAGLFLAAYHTNEDSRAVVKGDLPKVQHYEE